jgi:hypothetical protein
MNLQIKLYEGDTVWKRIENGCAAMDPDAQIAKEVYEGHKATHSGEKTDKKTGVDGAIIRRFNELEKPDSAYKFVTPPGSKNQ